jgi:hypothetical protein
VTTLNR